MGCNTSHSYSVSDTEQSQLRERLVRAKSALQYYEELETIRPAIPSEDSYKISETDSSIKTDIAVIADDFYREKQNLTKEIAGWYAKNQVLEVFRSKIKPNTEQVLFKNKQEIAELEGILSEKEKTLEELKKDNNTIVELEQQIKALNRDREDRNTLGRTAEYERKIEEIRIFSESYSLAELVKQREQEILELGSQSEDPRIKEIENQINELNDQSASNEDQLLEQINSLEIRISGLSSSNANLSSQ